MRLVGGQGDPTDQVQGFALTLAIGVGLSMLTAIFVTKRFLHLFVGTRIGRRANFFTS